MYTIIRGPGLVTLLMGKMHEFQILLHTIYEYLACYCQSSKKINYVLNPTVFQRAVFCVKCITLREGKLQKTDEAYKLMLMMDEKGCLPNVVTYTAMIDGYGKAGKIERCLEVFNLMHEKACAPNYVTYRVLIYHCCSFGLLDKAHELLEEMKQTYWPMHVASYSKVIEGFNQEFIVSLGLLDVFSGNEAVPIAPVYKVLVDSYCKAGRLEMALQLCKEMSSFASFHTMTHVYSSLIKSLCLASKVDEGFELFADMTKNGGVPEPSVFFHLVIGLVKLNRWDEALQISHSTCQMGIKWLTLEEMAQKK